MTPATQSTQCPAELQAGGARSAQGDQVRRCQAVRSVRGAAATDSAQRGVADSAQRGHSPGSRPTLALVPVQLKAEGDIYEDVGEDEYQEIVKKRREDEFIEDDGALADPL
eukprot:scaffold17683_cov69-Phaeocystis_antarctica.AAC.19